MAARAFEPPLAAASTLQKDLENAAAAAREVGLPLPMAAAALERYRLLRARGGDPDPAALISLLASDRG